MCSAENEEYVRRRHELKTFQGQRRDRAAAVRNGEISSDNYFSRVLSSKTPYKGKLDERTKATLKHTRPTQLGKRTGIDLVDRST